jgi:phosphate transport system protein
MSTTSIEQVVKDLDGQVIKLGALVERALVQALEALQAGDEEKAGTVVVDDTTIDNLHLSIEEHSIVTLAMHQPLPGREIRYLTSVQPITVDLERIGDEAEAIAQIIMRIVPLRQSKQLQGASGSFTGEGETFTEFTLHQRIIDLGWQTRNMLQRTMKAFEERDAQAARAIWEEDRVMDRHHYAMRRDLMAMLEGSQAIIALAHDPHILQRVTYLTWIAHNLERMADHCTNICERTVFIVEGHTDIKPSPDMENW